MIDLLAILFFLHLLCLFPFFYFAHLRFFSSYSAATLCVLAMLIFLVLDHWPDNRAEICEVGLDSLAWKAGLREGDTVQAVNGLPVTGQKEAERALFLQREAELTLQKQPERTGKFALPELSAPWWWPRVAGDDLDRFGGLSFRCRPPVLRILANESFRHQSSNFSIGSRIVTFGGKKVESRAELQALIESMDAEGALGLSYIGAARAWPLWLMKAWTEVQGEGNLFSLGSPESGLVVYRSRLANGLGNPLEPNFLPIQAVNETRRFSPLFLLAAEKEIKHLLVNEVLHQTSDFQPRTIVLLPHFVEGPALSGSVYLEPLRFFRRLLWARGFSFIDLAREWRSLPMSWYEIDSAAHLEPGYWLFRWACVALLLSLFSALGAMGARITKRGDTRNKKKLLLAVAVLGTVMMAKDLFVIWIL